MTVHTRRNSLALALALAVVGWGARDVRADAITYGTSGWVDAPAGAETGALTYQSANGTITGNGSVNLGQFMVSSAAQNGPTVTYTNDATHIFFYSGPDQSEQINGVINGQLGTGATTPLTLTVTSVSTFGSVPLPFTLNVPINTPMTISNSSGGGTSADSATIFSGAANFATPTPEPSSIAVFGLALGGLALWKRRRAAA